MKKAKLIKRVEVLEACLMYRNNQIVKQREELNGRDLHILELKRITREALIEKQDLVEVLESALEDRELMYQKLEDYSDSLKLYEEMQDNLVMNLANVPDLLDLIETLQETSLTT